MTLGWNLSMLEDGCSTNQHPDIASTRNTSNASLSEAKEQTVLGWNMDCLKNSIKSLEQVRHYETIYGLK